MQKFISVWNFEGIQQKPDPWTSRSLNTANQKGPLTPVGSSPHCVLLQVVSEDIVNLCYCLSTKKITLPLELSKLVECRKTGHVF